MICFLTSSPFLENENRLNPANGLPEELRKSLRPNCAALFICSDPDGHERTLFFAQAVKEAFEADGFSFGSFEILDGLNRKRPERWCKARISSSWPEVMCRLKIASFRRSTCVRCFVIFMA